MRVKSKRMLIALFVLLAAVLVTAPTVGAETWPQVANVASNGSIAIASTGTSNVAINADGRYVAFDSSARNLAPGDWINVRQIYVHDLQTGETTRVSVSSDGDQGSNGDQTCSAISADGRYVAFESSASNLATGGTNGLHHVYIHDRLTKQTSMVSVSSEGAQGNSQSGYSVISNDGRYVAFESNASNLVAGDTNGAWDIFVHDRQTGETTRVSVSSDGSQGNAWSYQRPAISTDGRYIAFTSNASNLVAGDTNGFPDIFVHDRQTGETTRVSIGTNEVQAYGSSNASSISADGNYVTFASQASNLVPSDHNGERDIFVHNRQTRETSRVSVASDGTEAIRGYGYSSMSSISTDGRYIAFDSWASNLVVGDTNDTADVFIHDRLTKQTTRVSVSSSGNQGDLTSYYPSISSDGQYIAFLSNATNLVPGATSTMRSVFVTQNPLYVATNLTPIANPGQNQTVHVSTTVTLDGSASTDPDNDYPLAYAWTFVSVPQNSAATLSNPTTVDPTFMADMPGDYVVSLIVTDSKGLSSAAAQVQISTQNTPPVADAGTDQSVIVIGTEVTLDGSNSYDVDGDDLTYQWTMVSKPVGSYAEISDNTSAQPTFIADVHGSYEFSLVVSDSWSNSVSAMTKVSFTNVKPVANAGVNQSVMTGDNVLLNGSGSNDANGDSLAYSWSIVTAPQGSAAIIGGANSSETSFIADLPGQYIVSLMVNDSFVNSDPSNITIVAISYQDAATGALFAVMGAVNSTPVASFNNPNNRNALTNKINAALDNIDQGNYADALSQLQNDILGKTDGCATTGAPDKNDWITVKSKTPTPEEIQAACTAQGQVYPLIIQAISYLQNL